MYILLNIDPTDLETMNHENRLIAKKKLEPILDWVNAMTPTEFDVFVRRLIGIGTPKVSPLHVLL